MAEILQRGVMMVSGIDVYLRTVPSVIQIKEGVKENNHGAPFATLEELAGACGLAVGSPTHFSNMASGLQYFLEQTSAIWYQGGMVDKPFTVFTSTGSMHGGQETTLINMMTPLLHHGMINVGVPYTVPEVQSTQTGGGPYGASHLSGGESGRNIDENEYAILLAQGKRLAKVALAMNAFDSMH